MTERIFVGGLTEGVNFPKWKYIGDRPFVDLTDCKDIILVDREYFLDYLDLIRTWALAMEDEGKETSSDLSEVRAI